MQWHRLTLGLGANTGQPQQQIPQALQSLCALVDGRYLTQSSLYKNAAMLHPDNPQPQPDYYNQVATVTTPADPEYVLAIAKRIERRMGRELHAPPWSARPVDIDLLDYDGWQYHSNRLVLPHPGIAKRRFVLEPWLEIEPEQTVTYILLKKLLRRLT